jgi:hypothetical protein
MQLQSDVQQCSDDIAVAEEDALPGIKQSIVKLMEHMAPLAGQIDAINTRIMEVCASLRPLVPNTECCYLILYSHVVCQLERSLGSDVCIY